VRLKEENQSVDIDMIRLKSELVALETLVVALARSLASWQPSLDKSLRATADELRERHRHLPMADSSPETADLAAARFQEAWDRLMQLVLRQDRAGGVASVAPGVHTDMRSARRGS
jgi:hypothetical protein